MYRDTEGVPPLQKLCIEAAASKDFWRVQTRHLEVLPEEYGNDFVNILIKSGRLTPTDLYKFHEQVTEISIKRQRIQTLKRWIPCISTLRSLRSLVLSTKETVCWKPLPALINVAPTLQSLTVEGLSGYGMSSSINSTLRNTLASLTALTHLRLAGFENKSLNEVTFNVADLENLSLLQKLELHAIHLGEPEHLSALVRLTNLNSISLKPHSRGRLFEYAPGVLYLGALPNLQHFEWGGGSGCSCPPVATTLTSLIWRVDMYTETKIHEAAELAWLEMKPKLEKLQQFSFISKDSNVHEPIEITTIATNIILGAAASLTKLYFKSNTKETDFSFLSQCTNLKSLSLQNELTEVNEAEKGMDALDVEYIDPLPPEVLAKYDERYRYSLDELEELGERWKNSVQGKREMNKLRGKLADGDLVLSLI